MGKHEAEEPIEIGYLNEVPEGMRPVDDDTTLDLFVHTFSNLEASFVNIKGGQFDGEYLRVTLKDTKNGTRLNLHFDSASHIVWKNITEKSIMLREMMGTGE